MYISIRGSLKSGVSRRSICRATNQLPGAVRRAYYESYKAPEFVPPRVSPRAVHSFSFFGYTRRDRRGRRIRVVYICRLCRSAEIAGVAIALICFRMPLAPSLCVWIYIGSSEVEGEFGGFVIVGDSESCLFAGFASTCAN